MPATSPCGPSLLRSSANGPLVVAPIRVGTSFLLVCPPNGPQQSAPWANPALEVPEAPEPEECQRTSVVAIDPQRSEIPRHFFGPVAPDVIRDNVRLSRIRLDLVESSSIGRSPVRKVATARHSSGSLGEDSAIQLTHPRWSHPQRSRPFRRSISYSADAARQENGWLDLRPTRVRRSHAENRPSTTAASSPASRIPALLRNPRPIPPFIRKMRQRHRPFRDIIQVSLPQLESPTEDHQGRVEGCELAHQPARQSLGVLSVASQPKHPRQQRSQPSQEHPSTRADLLG